MMYAIFKLLINYFITFRRTFIIFLSYFVLYSSITVNVVKEVVVNIIAYRRVVIQII